MQRRCELALGLGHMDDSLVVSVRSSPVDPRGGWLGRVRSPRVRPPGRAVLEIPSCLAVQPVRITERPTMPSFGYPGLPPSMKHSNRGLGARSEVQVHT